MVAPGQLYLVPTPIGNLDDISRRALKILTEVDLVACEDTRTTGRLLKLYNLQKRLISYHDFNERRRAAELITALHEGKSVAVVTDAGSPGISDPAYRVVRAAIEAGMTITPLPGPNAVIPALAASGLPTDRFFFEGFLPNKGGARRTRLGKLTNLEHTLIFFESPHRIVKSLTDMLAVFGDRPACVAREISKKFEEFIRGNLSEILSSLDGRTVKGEIVVVLAGTGFTDKNRRSDDSESSVEPE